MSTNKCQFSLLASNGHGIKKVICFKEKPPKIVCPDLLGDLKPLYDIGEAECFVSNDKDDGPLAGNYNRARVGLHVHFSTFSRTSLTVEGTKAEGLFSYSFALETPGIFFKNWKVTSERPLDFRKRENNWDDLRGPRWFECQEEDHQTIDAYFPFKFNYKGSWTEAQGANFKFIENGHEQGGDSIADFTARIGAKRLINDLEHYAYLGGTYLTNQLSEALKGVTSCYEHWKKAQTQGLNGPSAPLSERWLHHYLLGLNLYWRIFYDYAKTEIDSLEQTATEGMDDGTRKDMMLKRVLALKRLQACCEQLAAFDLEKFEAIEESVLIEFVERVQNALPSSTYCLEGVILGIPKLNQELDRGRMKASLAKNLTPAQLEAAEQKRDFIPDSSLSPRTYCAEMVKFFQSHLLNPNSIRFIEKSGMWQYTEMVTHPHLTFGYFDIGDNRYIFDCINSINCYDPNLSTEGNSRILITEKSPFSLKLLGYLPSLSKALFTTFHTDQRCLYEFPVPPAGQSPDPAHPVQPTAIVGLVEDEKVRYCFSVQGLRIFALEVRLAQETSVSIMELQLGEGQPTLVRKETLETASITEHCGPTLLEFKELLKRNRLQNPGNTEVISNGRHLLIFTRPQDFCFSEGKISHMILAGIDLVNRRKLALLKIKVMVYESKWNGFPGYLKLFRMPTSSRLACLYIDPVARWSQIFVFKNHKIQQLVDAALPREFPELHTVVFDARCLAFTAWEKVKKEGTVALVDKMFRLNL